MLIEAFKWLAAHAEPNTIDRDGLLWCDRSLKPILRERLAPSSLVFPRLQGFVDFLNNKDINDDIFVVVESPTSVVAYAKWNESNNLDFRIQVAQATYDHQPISRVSDMRQDQFMVYGLTSFVDTPERKRLLQTVAALESGESRLSEDDGVSQVVTMKGGVKIKSVEAVKNPFTLRQYRTWSEVAQPESQYILRIGNGSYGPILSLHDSQGDYWMLAAVQNIVSYLTKELKEIPVY